MNPRNVAMRWFLPSLCVIAAQCSIIRAIEKQTFGFKVEFGGAAQRNSSANYDVEIVFYGKDDTYEYINSCGISPYSPENATWALTRMLNRDKIETEKVGDSGFIITGYRGPDDKLHLVKSVRITPKDGTTAEKVPTVKDTRPKS